MSISYNMPFMYTVLAFNLEYENGFEVGRPHKISCTVYIVDHTNVNISWNGPNGLIANVIISGRRLPFQLATSDGHIHTVSVNCNSQASMHIYCRKILCTNCILYIDHYSIDTCMESI